MAGADGQNVPFGPGKTVLAVYRAPGLWASPSLGRRMMNGNGLRQAMITDITKKLFLKLTAFAWLCRV